MPGGNACNILIVSTETEPSFHCYNRLGRSWTYFEKFCQNMAQLTYGIGSTGDARARLHQNVQLLSSFLPQDMVPILLYSSYNQHQNIEEAAFLLVLGFSERSKREQ